MNQVLTPPNARRSFASVIKDSPEIEDGVRMENAERGPDPRKADSAAVHEIRMRRAELSTTDLLALSPFDRFYGYGSEKALFEKGLFVDRAEYRGETLIYQLFARNGEGLRDERTRIAVCDTGANVQFKSRGEPDPELMARCLVEIARLRGWPGVDVASDGKLAAAVREHVFNLGVPVIVPGRGLVDPAKDAFVLSRTKHASSTPATH